MARFKLDAEQTDAILELKIYRLARLEILVIQKELAEKRKRAKEIGGLLKRDADLWKIVRDGDRGRSRRRTATRAARRSPARCPTRSTPPTTSSSKKTTSSSSRATGG